MTPVNNEPLEIVLSDDEGLEPSRNMSRTEDSEDLPAIVKTLIAENQKLKEDVKNLHRAILEFSNTTIDDKIQLLEKIQKIEMENLELKEIILDNKKFTEEKLLENKISIKDEQSKMKETTERMEKSLEASQKCVDSQIYEMKSRFSNLQYDFEKLEEELEICEKRVSKLELETTHEAKNEELKNSFIIPSDAFNFPPNNAELEYLEKCIFCNNSPEHISINCETVPSYSDRIRILQEQGRCTKCLELPENHSLCVRDRVMCSNCEWNVLEASEETDFHHEIVCKFNDWSKFRETRRQTENERRLSHGLPPRFT